MRRRKAATRHGGEKTLSRAIMTDNALTTAGLGFTVGGASVLQDVDLTVAAGEFLGIIGPNGAGKTTLFNLLSGVLRPSAGSIELAGRDVTGLAPAGRARLGIGRTFQTSLLFNALPAAENVRLAAQASAGGSARWWHRPGRTDRTTAKAGEAIEAVGLTAVAARPASALSHGDKRKLELAILMAGDASVLLLDEPMAGVNPRLMTVIEDYIMKLAKQGVGIMMIEHRMESVERICDSVMVMARGEVISTGDFSTVRKSEAVIGAYIAG